MGASRGIRNLGRETEQARTKLASNHNLQRLLDKKRGEGSNASRNLLAKTSAKSPISHDGLDADMTFELLENCMRR